MNSRLISLNKIHNYPEVDQALERYWRWVNGMKNEGKDIDSQIDQVFKRLWRSGPGAPRITITRPLRWEDCVIEPGDYEFDCQTSQWVRMAESSDG